MHNFIWPANNFVNLDTVPGLIYSIGDLGTVSRMKCPLDLYDDDHEKGR